MSAHPLRIASAIPLATLLGCSNQDPYAPVPGPGTPTAWFGFAMTPDAAVIVGKATSAAGVEAFRWTEAGGMVGSEAAYDEAPCH
jgi:hypothetical protein